MNSRYGIKTFALELVMVVVAVIFLFPIYVLVTASFKSAAEINAGGLGLPQGLDTFNYSEAWEQASLGSPYLNSLWITSLSVLLLVILGASASYYLARTKTHLSYGMYILFLMGIILPFQLALVPLYRMIFAAGLLGTYTAIIVFYVGLQLPLTTFLYTGFLRALPAEYGEAALVDGAGHLQSFMQITFPLLRPITGTVVILNGVAIWNDFFTPLLYLTGSGKETLPVGIYSFVGQYGAEWGPIFAAVILASLPMLGLFLLLQKYMIKGFASGLKG